MRPRSEMIVLHLCRSAKVARMPRLMAVTGAAVGTAGVALLVIGTMRQRRSDLSASQRSTACAVSMAFGDRALLTA
ncbi:hypothetical protein KZ770_26650 [Escherichia coli]|nr:hypothetical protein [Escherichia coli]